VVWRVPDSDSRSIYTAFQAWFGVDGPNNSVPAFKFRAIAARFTDVESTVEIVKSSLVAASLAEPPKL